MKGAHPANDGDSDNYGGLFDRIENGHRAAEGLEAVFPDHL
jgi:hypothetical protein